MMFEKLGYIYRREEPSRTEQTDEQSTESSQVLDKLNTVEMIARLGFSAVVKPGYSPLIQMDTCDVIVPLKQLQIFKGDRRSLEHRPVFKDHNSVSERSQ